MAMKFAHIGIPTKTPKDGEIYSEGMKVYLTDVSKSKHKIEWLRFDADSWLPQEIQNHAHAAFYVDNLEEAIGNQKVILGPVDASETLRLAFVIDEEGCPVEYMEVKGEISGAAY